MPIVHVNVWEGFGQKHAKTVIQGITKVFVNWVSLNMQWK